MAMRRRPTVHLRRSLKAKIRELERTWKHSREYHPGKTRYGFYRYLKCVFEFYCELRMTKGAANKARDRIIKMHLLPSAKGLHAINAIIRASSGEDPRTQSRWAQALRFAWKWRKKRGTMKLWKFFELNGGVAGCATKLANNEPPILK
jgi:hypothetical protein